MWLLVISLFYLINLANFDFHKFCIWCVFLLKNLSIIIIRDNGKKIFLGYKAFAADNTDADLATFIIFNFFQIFIYRSANWFYHHHQLVADPNQSKCYIIILIIIICFCSSSSSSSKCAMFIIINSQHHPNHHQVW